MRLKLVVSLPNEVTAEQFLAFCKNQVIGRYGNDRRISEYWLPQLLHCGYRGYIKSGEKYTCTLYECNAEDLQPFYISVIDTLKNFGMLNYFFTLDGVPVEIEWCPDGFEKNGYDVDEAEESCDFWQETVCKIENGAKKIA